MVTANAKTGTLTEKGDLRVLVQCKCCNGSGSGLVKLGVRDLVDIYEKHPNNKIERIKVLRDKTDLGLKAAKEVIEAYDQLLSDLLAIKYS